MDVPVLKIWLVFEEKSLNRSDFALGKWCRWWHWNYTVHVLYSMYSTVVPRVLHTFLLFPVQHRPVFSLEKTKDRSKGILWSFTKPTVFVVRHHEYSFYSKYTRIHMYCILIKRKEDTKLKRSNSPLNCRKTCNYWVTLPHYYLQ